MRTGLGASAVGIVAFCCAAFAQPAERESTPLGHVEVRGEGPVPLVLIPGFASDWRVWDAFMSRNAGRYTMYAVTLPGFGGTGAPPPTADPTGWLENAAEAVGALVEERGLKDAVVAGHSLGGHVALLAAARRPELFGGAVTIDGLPAYPLQGDPTPEQRLAAVNTVIAPQVTAMSDADWAAMQRGSAQQWTGDSGRAEELAAMFSQTPRDVGCAYFIEVLRSDLSERLAALEKPVLAVAALAPRSEAAMTQWETVRQTWRDAFANSPSAVVVFFEETRHLVMDERPAELDKAIAQFVAGDPVLDPELGPPPAAPAER